MSDMKMVNISATLTSEANTMLDACRELRRGNRSHAVEDAIRSLYYSEKAKIAKERRRRPIKDRVHKV